MTAADQQALIGVPIAARVTFRDQDGEIMDPGGTVTAVVSSSWDQFSSYPLTATPVVDGYEVAIQPVTAPDQVIVEWTAGTHEVTTTVDVVGGYYASISDMRGSTGEFINDALTDVTKYPQARLAAARRFVEEEFETFTGRAFVPRFDVYATRCDGHVVIPHPDVRAIRTLTVNGNTAPLPAAVMDGMMILGGFNHGDVVTVGYEHGMTRPPEQIRRAFFLRARAAVNAITSAIPDRATTFSSEGGATYSLLTEGRGGSLTAIPAVDIALRSWTHKEPVVG